jgi:predicted nucleic acid-binding protein
VRALVGGHPVALAWLARVELGELDLYWPTLVYLEVANALLSLHRRRVLSRAGTLEILKQRGPLDREAVPRADGR